MMNSLSYQIIRRAAVAGERSRHQRGISSPYKSLSSQSTIATHSTFTAIRSTINAAVATSASNRFIPQQQQKQKLGFRTNHARRIHIFDPHSLRVRKGVNSPIDVNANLYLHFSSAREEQKQDHPASAAHPETSSVVEVEPMDKRLLFQYLQLKSFTDDEISHAIDRIHGSGNGSGATVSYDNDIIGGMNESTDASSISAPKEEVQTHDLIPMTQHDNISEKNVTAFILNRIIDIDNEQQKDYDFNYEGESENANGKGNADGVYETKEGDANKADSAINEDEARRKRDQMQMFAKLESQKAMKLLLGNQIKNHVNLNTKSTPPSAEYSQLHKAQIRRRILELANEIDTSRTIPIASSMLLVGSSVGIIIPVMPYVVSNLGLSAGQFGIVVSSFAFAKLFANIPAAVLVERHGRKPYLVHSLVIISMGVGGIGLATQFEHLILCRTLTGIGVSLLSTAATLSIADISTPLNRARTMAPMMSAFAAGTALGPAVGGLLADKIGVQSTFYLVGGMYLALTSINQMALTETILAPEKERVFPWQDQQHSANASSMGIAGRKRRRRKVLRKKKKEDQSVFASIKNAVTQWGGLLEDKKVRNVALMNGFYWISLSGAQMTLLPLILTDPEGLGMSPTNVGELYMGMSLVQVFGNPPMAGFVDKMGKVPGIVAGCSLLSASMFALPYCTDMKEVAGTLAFWALGSTMLSTAPTAYISDAVREDQRAQAIALLRTAGDVGFLVGASTTGAVADLFNMDVAVHSSASLLLTATGWFAVRRYLDVTDTKCIK